MNTQSRLTRRDTLPAPTGPHPVGRTTLELVDRARQEIFAADPTARRELVMWTWYPAAPTPVGAARADYLPAPWALIADQLGLDIAGVHAHAVSDAPVSGHQPTYPVLLLSPSGFSPLLLTTLAEHLASGGYVVVGINHTYETAVSVFADGRVVPMNPAALGGALGPQGGPHDAAFERRRQVCAYKTRDLSSVADHLARLDVHPTGLGADRLDLSRLGALGHSFGGNAALEWCRIDPRCRAAANLDGALWTDVRNLGLARPVLQLLAEHPEFAMTSADAVAAGIAPDAAWYEAERAIAFGGWRTVAELGPQAHTLQIAGATHLSFMDLPFLAVRDGSPVVPMLAATTIDPTRMARITGEIVQAFFDQYLDLRPSQLLERPDRIGPEVTLGPPSAAVLTLRDGGR
jgi:dienelactone hydrolase